MLSVPSVANRPLRRPAARRGAIAVFVAFLLVVLLGFSALCVDIGWIALTKSELQNAADSAAAAGASPLMDGYASYSTPGQRNKSGIVDSSKQKAAVFCERYGDYNAAGGVSALKILPGDVQFGFTDAAGKFSAAATGYPNTVQVLARRDSSANNRLGLFFAPVLGMRDTALTATASATVYNGLIASFDPHGGGIGSGKDFHTSDDGAWGEDYDSAGDAFTCTLLPVAFDVNHWNAFFNTGASPDGTLAVDASGNPQIQIYPSPQTAPGNVGLLCLGHWTNSDPDFRKWVLDGPTQDDLDNLQGGGWVPVNQSSPRPWKGSPGLKSELRREFAQIIGQPRLLPLFQPASQAPYQAASGHGANATYKIVGFVGVTITSVTGAGNNMNISVKPCDVIDPTAVYDPTTVFPAGAEPPTQLKAFTHPAPKFTQ